MSHELLNDRWYSRDFPILLAAAKAADSGEELLVDPLCEQLNVRYRDVLAAMDALRDSGYFVNIHFSHDMGGTFSHIRLTEKARRAVGLWPNGDTAAEALLDALRQAEDLAEDPDDRSALRKAAGQLGSVSRSVIADLTTAYIRSQTGI